MFIIDVFVLGQKLARSPHLLLGLLAASALVAAIFFASMLFEDDQSPDRQFQIVTGIAEEQPSSDDEIHISALQDVDDQPAAQAEETSVRQILNRLALKQPLARSDERIP